MKHRIRFAAYRLTVIATILAIFYTSCASEDPTPTPERAGFTPATPVSAPAPTVTPERAGVIAVTATVDVADYVTRQVAMLEANETQVALNATATVKYAIISAETERLNAVAAVIQLTAISIQATHIAPTVTPVPSPTSEVPIPPSPFVIPFDMNTATQASLLRLNEYIRDETKTSCRIGEATADLIATFIAETGPIETLEELEPVRNFTIGEREPEESKSTQMCLAPFTVQPAS